MFTMPPLFHNLIRAVIERVGLLMTVASAWQFTDGIQVYNASSILPDLNIVLSETPIIFH